MQHASYHKDIWGELPKKYHLHLIFDLPCRQGAFCEAIFKDLCSCKIVTIFAQLSKSAHILHYFPCHGSLYVKYSCLGLALLYF